MKIIIIVISFLLIIFLLTSKNVEKFDLIESSIEFISKEESCYIFQKNHKQYFSKMEYKESKIRGCIKNFNDFHKKIDKCRNHYCNNTMNFNNSEKKNLIFSINIINDIYKKHFPKMLDLPWKFIKVSNNVEGGMPHTINDYIVLPQNFLKYLETIINSNDQSSLIKFICTTIIHEQIHVFQKINYQIFKDLYQKYWNFEPCNIKLKEKYIKYQRINPDGYDDWCFVDKKHSIYPFVKLKDDSIHLNDVKTLAIPINNNKIDYKSIYDINTNNYYNRFFCNVSQNYHPNEISAIILSDFIINKIYPSSKNLEECQALKFIKPWIKKYLQ
jgi:hypothetical protein